MHFVSTPGHCFKLGFKKLFIEDELRSGFPNNKDFLYQLRLENPLKSFWLENSFRVICHANDCSNLDKCSSNSGPPHDHIDNHRRGSYNRTESHKLAMDQLWKRTWEQRIFILPKVSAVQRFQQLILEMANAVCLTIFRQEHTRADWERYSTTKHVLL